MNPCSDYKNAHYVGMAVIHLSVIRFHDRVSSDEISLFPFSRSQPNDFAIAYMTNKDTVASIMYNLH